MFYFYIYENKDFCKLIYPLFLNIARAEEKQDQTKSEQDGQADAKTHKTISIDSIFQYIHPVGQGQNKGNGLKKQREGLHRDKKATQKHHGKAEKIGKSLRFKDFINSHSYEQA